MLLKLNTDPIYVLKMARHDKIFIKKPSKNRKIYVVIFQAMVEIISEIEIVPQWHKCKFVNL